MKKHPKSDADIMIEQLGQAAAHGSAEATLPMKVDYPSRASAILHNLIDDGMIDGDTINDTGAIVNGITLRGRLFRDELIAKRNARSWKSRLAKAGWAVAGGIGALFLTYLKALVEHVVK